MEWLTIIAIIAGPCVGVYLTRCLDDYKDKKQRRIDIFRTLMRTRGVRLSYDHVGALNLVEVEFADKKDVIDAWKAYLTELGVPYPTNDESGVLVKQQKTNKLLTRLIDEIAKALKFQIEQLDILETNYTPQGWLDDEAQQRYLRTLLISLLSGNNPLPIAVRDKLDTNSSPFPPRPNQE